MQYQKPISKSEINKNYANSRIFNIMQKIGNRAARIELNIKDHQWYRMQREIKEIESDKKNHKFLAILDLENKLKEFKMIKRSDLENLKKCNENINIQ